MKEIKITEDGIANVAAWIKEHSEHISSITRSEEDSLPPAIKIIRCVLSLRTSYDKVVVPRVERFKSEHPNIQQVGELARLIESYPNPIEFIQQELNYKSKRKANMLQQVTEYLCQIIQKTPNIREEDSLRKWAIQAKPQECYTWNIKYFKLAGFQYLRMLFGADTVKPDVHIIRYLSELLNRYVSPIESIFLMEAASKHVGLSVRDVDAYIWITMARKQND